MKPAVVRPELCSRERLDSPIDPSFEANCSSEEKRATFIETAKGVLKQRLQKVSKEYEKESEAQKEDKYTSQFRSTFDLDD
jgi:hypothetical protein